MLTVRQEKGTFSPEGRMRYTRLQRAPVTEDVVLATPLPSVPS